MQHLNIHTQNMVVRFGQRISTTRLWKVTTNSESTTSNAAQADTEEHNRLDTLVVNECEKYATYATVSCLSNS